MRAWATRFFGVAAQPRTWLNLAYLWLALPLGIFYFVFFTVGLSVGLGLVVVWIGLPILLVVGGAWWLFGAFERLQAEHLLGVPVRPAVRTWELHEGVWAKLRGHFADGSTWRDLLYLLTKLPLGAVCFTLAMTALGSTLWLLALPLFSYYGTPAANAWVPSPWAAAGGVAAGVLACFVWLHILNAAAWVCARWALLIFGSERRSLGTTLTSPPAVAGRVTE
jgi:hypothetical protein